VELERLLGYVAVAPILGICFLGVVLAVIRRDERSRVPLLVGTSAVLLAIVTILEPLSLRAAMERYPAPESMHDLNRFLALVRFIFNTQRAFCFGLLLWAIFAERAPETSTLRTSGLMSH
jgi:hypothetical protein